jgi:zinc transport system substrate-binding protein
VRAVGGEAVDVKMLIDPGTEVHSFDPTPSDIAAVYNADLFVYIGGESEKWVDRVLRDVNVSSLIMMGQVKRIEERHNHSHEDHNGHDHENDEHIWTSPENALLMLEAICGALCELDPDNESLYRFNLDEYSGKIKELQTELHGIVRESKSRFILVADRFPFIYFTEEFGIDHKAAFGGCAVSNDISLKVMGELVREVNEHNCKSAFYTEMSNRSIADALSEHTGVKLYELHSAHNVTLDDFKSGVTYVDIMKRNIESLRKGMY